jgi:hypothetical protein
VLSVIEQPAVSQALDEAIANHAWPRALDAWEAITWAVVREPYLGEALTESGRIRQFTFDGAKSIGMPTVSIVYEIGHTEIIIHAARFEDSRFSTAGRA